MVSPMLPPLTASWWKTLCPSLRPRCKCVPACASHGPEFKDILDALLALAADREDDNITIFT